MINEGTEPDKYKKTEDNILKLKSFQSFLYCYFKDTPCYE